MEFAPALASHFDLGIENGTCVGRARQICFC
jgi:hypothetical protein